MLEVNFLQVWPVPSWGCEITSANHHVRQICLSSLSPSSKLKTYSRYKCVVYTTDCSVIELVKMDAGDGLDRDIGVVFNVTHTIVCARDKQSC